jgi:hypothetical protein
MKTTIAVTFLAALGLLPSALAGDQPAAAPIFLNLYSDENCSVSLSGVTLHPDTCSADAIDDKPVAFQSAKLYGEPNLNGMVHFFPDVHCKGKNISSTNAGYLGCMKVHGSAMSVDYDC